MWHSEVVLLAGVVRVRRLAMGAVQRTNPQAGSAVLALVLALVIGVGAAFGLALGLVSLGSNATQSTRPLVSYNAP